MKKTALLMAIEQMRDELQDLIKQKNNIMDEEILQKSQDLDRLLNVYADILKSGSE